VIGVKAHIISACLCHKVGAWAQDLDVGWEPLQHRAGAVLALGGLLARRSVIVSNTNHYLDIRHLCLLPQVFVAGMLMREARRRRNVFLLSDTLSAIAITSMFKLPSHLVSDKTVHDAKPQVQRWRGARIARTPRQ
jgi:hypothetical protein